MLGAMKGGGSCASAFPWYWKLPRGTSLPHLAEVALPAQPSVDDPFLLQQPPLERLAAQRQDVVSAELAGKSHALFAGSVRMLAWLQVRVPAAMRAPIGVDF